VKNQLFLIGQEAGWPPVTILMWRREQKIVPLQGIDHRCLGLSACNFVTMLTETDVE